MQGSVLRRLGLTALGLALLVAVTILLSCWRNWEGFQNSEILVVRKQRILEETNSVYAGLRDAETGQRGFLLTGREAYLGPYYVGAANTARHLYSLTEVTRATSEQGTVQRLGELISFKLTELQQTIDVRRRAGFPSALQIVQTDRGKAVMDEIRAVCDGLESRQYAGLTSSSADLRVFEIRTLLITAVGSILLLMLVASAIAALYRHSHQRDRLIADLGRSRQEIAEVRELLQTTLGSIGDAVIATDSEGLVTFTNHVAQSLTGWTQEAAFRVHLDTVFRIVNDHTRLPVESPVARVLNGGSVVGLANHTILIRKDGGEIHIDDSGAPIRDRYGKINGVVLVFRDIGERRKAEIEIENASRQTSEILASIADGFLSFDSSFCVLYANARAAELLNASSPGNLEGHILWTECPALSGTAFAQVVLRAMKERTIVEIDDLIGNRWVAVRAYPARNGLSVYLVDITEEQRLAKDLDASRQRLSRSLSAAKAAVWEWDVRSAGTVWSGEFGNLFGRYSQPLEFSRVQDYPLLHSEDRPLLEEYAKQLIGGRFSSTLFEFRILTAGEVKWIGLVGEVVERENGRPSRLAGLAIDITERKRLEDKLRDAAKLESLGVLAGGIAHDFNNLLTGILANATLAEEELEPTSPLLPYVRQVVEASERAADLTRQMLAYSGKGSFIVEPLDISKEVREIVDLLRVSVGHAVDLRLNLDTYVPLIEADPAQIQQLVMNLVINAAEAVGDKPGSVTIVTGVCEMDEESAVLHLNSYPLVPGTYVTLEVEDTGHGMDEATKAKIFDPFFSTKFTGRGLGLAAVQGIVRGLKAAIEVQSTPGFGTMFRIYLPAKRERLVTPPAETARPWDRGEGTVLIVDDEKFVQQVTARALERHGFEVVTAGNGEQAVDLLMKFGIQIRLIILDLTMPVMSGEQTLAEIRRLQPAVPVLATSGYSESEALDKFGGGVEGFLQKPFTSATLIKQVSRILLPTSEVD